MSADNARIGEMFDRLADLLEIEDANPFRIRAYRNGAQTVREHPRSMADLINEEKDLRELPGIGKDLAEKIRAIVETGRLPALEEVEARTPGVLSDLMKIPGLGPKKVKALYKELNIRSVADLRTAAREQRIRGLPGFAARTEEQILRRTEKFSVEERRFNLLEAEQIKNPLMEWMEKLDGLSQLIVAGSFRRRKETVGDLDLLVTARRNTPVMEHFTGYEEIAEVVSRGTTRSTVRLVSGMQVDLRLVPKTSYGAALHYFTGSKTHNIAIRKMGVKRKLKVNEYGVFRGDKQIGGRTERAVYGLFDMPYIEPELREFRGEIEAALENRLPRLVGPKAIHGDMLCYATDARSTSALAKRAVEREYEWLGVCFDSEGGLDRKQIITWRRALDRTGQRLGIELLLIGEAAIAKDGSIVADQELLSEFDLVAVVVRDGMHLDHGAQTRRLLRALENPHVKLLTSPTGRVIGRYPGMDYDLKRVLAFAAERECMVGLDARPDRLDLSDEACRLAKEVGATVAICSHARTPDELDNLRFGLDQARRGWLERGDLVNTRNSGVIRGQFPH